MMMIFHLLWNQMESVWFQNEEKIVSTILFLTVWGKDNPKACIQRLKEKYFHFLS